MTQRESPEDDSPRVSMFHDHCYRGYFQGYFKLLFSLQRPLVNYSSSSFHLLSPFQRLWKPHFILDIHKNYYWVQIPTNHSFEPRYSCATPPPLMWM